MAIINFYQKAILVNAENKFLALKKSYGQKTWDLPGGAVEIPEEHETALRREIREETGVEVDSAIVPLQVVSGYNKEDDEYFLFIGYRAAARKESVTLSDEHTDYRWVTKEDFLQLDATSYLKDFVAALHHTDAVS